MRKGFLNVSGNFPAARGEPAAVKKGGLSGRERKLTECREIPISDGYSAGVSLKLVSELFSACISASDSRKASVDSAP